IYMHTNTHTDTNTHENTHTHTHTHTHTLTHTQTVITVNYIPEAFKQRKIPRLILHLFFSSCNFFLLLLKLGLVFILSSLTPLLLCLYMCPPVCCCVGVCIGWLVHYHLSH